MTERRPIGTWFYTPQAGGTFFLWQHDEPEPTFFAVVMGRGKAEYLCEKLNEAPGGDGEAER